MIMLEVCVDNARGVDTAVAAGADRIELCSALELGGLTPSAGLIDYAASCGIPVRVMIRPRAGDFCFDTKDEDVMLRDIAAVRQAGLAGVVLGASHADGSLNIAMLTRLVAASQGLGLTLHRVFDTVPDRSDALETAVSLGFDRILTSGGADSATAGAAELGRLMAKAAGRIIVMPGAGITAASINALLDLPLVEVHGSCARLKDNRRETSADEIRALKAALR